MSLKLLKWMKDPKVKQISDNEIEEDQQVSMAGNRVAKRLKNTNSKEAGIGNCSPESEVQLSRIINRTDDWQSSPHQGGAQVCKDAEAMCFLESNPGLQNMFMKMIKAGIQEGIKETTASLQGSATKSGELSGKNSNSKGNNTKSKSNSTNFVKSPSDTTLYTPAVQRVTENKRVEDMINKISNFVEEIRNQSAQQSEPRDRRPPAGDSRMVKRKLNMKEDDDIQPGTSGMIEPSPKQVSDKFILEAEHFRENVEPPVKDTYDTLDDDNYFHLACHVDENLKEKIEHGEFVDLEKLLPKQRPHKSGGERLEWVSKDGMTYLAPAQDRENHISNIWKWDQAFRVYAAIYCNVNPGRAGEIWQYIYVIHSAASTFQWDNVAYYDFTVDSYKCLWMFIGCYTCFSGLQSSLGITNDNRSHNKPLELN